jgi:predicted phosphoribosyltransferase
MFQNRQEAGKLLANELNSKDFKNSIVVAIPRGGVVNGFEIAKILRLPLELILVKKIGHPLNPEFAVGAVSEHQVLLEDKSLFTQDELEKKVTDLRKKLKKQKLQFYKKRKSYSLSGKNIILTDDGAATGNTMFLCVKELRSVNVNQIKIALPVCPYDTFLKLKRVADEIICLEIPSNFDSVGQFYKEFDQVENEEVERLFNF